MIQYRNVRKANTILSVQHSFADEIESGTECIKKNYAQYSPFLIRKTANLKTYIGFDEFQ